MPDDGVFRATDNQPARRLGGATGRGFMPGKSGNPSGRPRGIEARCREFTDDALRALLEALQNPKERVAAASVLLSYGWGRPKQIIEANEATSVTVMHLLAARESGDALLRRLKTPLVDGDAVERETQQIVDLAALPMPEE